MGTFDASLKKWFYQNSSSAASASARIPLLDASGNPNGSDTLSKVLGSMGGSTFYGTCSTDSTTAAKTATISGFVLAANVVVAIRFTSSVGVPGATLNVNSTGAKPIYIDGAVLQPGVIKAGVTAMMSYDGTKWNIISLLGLETSQGDSDLYVDLGLPSGLLWAKCNIDLTQANGFAASPYQYEGTFFSWGNTFGVNNKPGSTTAFVGDYNWGGVNENEPYYSGQVYGSTPGVAITANLSPSMDAARANLGAPWRLPTNTEFGELFNNIDYIDASGSAIASTATDKRITYNGVVGLRLRSKNNGKEIFFPASGNGAGSSWSSRGSNGYYWSSTWNSARNARYLYFYSGGVGPQSSNHRYYGFPVRPVQ